MIVPKPRIGVRLIGIDFSNVGICLYTVKLVYLTTRIWLYTIAIYSPKKVFQWP